MTVKELIDQLLEMPQQANVCVYETDPDDYLPVGKLVIADNGNQVNLESQYAVDNGLCSG